MTQFTRRVAAAGAAALALAVTTGTGGTAVRRASPRNPELRHLLGGPHHGRVQHGEARHSCDDPGGDEDPDADRRQGVRDDAERATTSWASPRPPARPAWDSQAGRSACARRSTSSGTSCSAVDAAAGETPEPRPRVAWWAPRWPRRPPSTSTSSRAPRSGRPPSSATTPSGGSTCAAAARSRAPTPVSPAPTAFQECNNPADSGPDSGVNNNCRWNISAPELGRPADDGVVFDRLELKAHKGSFSLMGGADGSYAPLRPTSSAYQNSSVLEIVEGACLREHGHPQGHHGIVLDAAREPRR